MVICRHGNRLGVHSAEFLHLMNLSLDLFCSSHLIFIFLVGNAMTSASSDRGVLAATVSLLLLFPLTARCYNVCLHHRVVRGRTVSAQSSALSATTADAMHFEKFDLTHLPDAMVNSTVWVGNLNEFVTDNELGRLFAKGGGASPLNVPAVVARRPNNDSLRYGVVHFHTSADAQVSVFALEEEEDERGGEREKEGGSVVV